MDTLEQEKNQEVVKGFKSHIPLIIAVAVIGVLIWFWHKEFSKYVRTDDALIDSDMVGVSPKIMGRIVKIYFHETDSVKKGDLLAELDSSELKAKQFATSALVKKCEVAIQSAVAEYDLSKEQFTIQKINMQKAQTDYERAQVQFKGSVIPLETFEHIQKNYETNQALIQVAEKKSDLVESQIQVAKTQLEKAEAQFRLIRTQLNNTRIYAPFDGVLAKRWLLPGDVVMPGQAIYSLVNDTDYWVSVYIEENYLSHLKIGSRAIVTVDAYPDFTFKGRVYYVASNAALEFSINPPNNAAGNFTKIAQRFNVKIVLDTVLDKENHLRSVKLLPGMSAVVKIRKMN